MVWWLILLLILGVSAALTGIILAILPSETEEPSGDPDDPRMPTKPVFKGWRI